jgi:hypothetical protein
MPDGTVAPGQYAVQWGYHVGAKELRKPRLWEECPPLTFVGSMKVLARDTIVCAFAVDGQEFEEPVEQAGPNGATIVSRAVAFETICKDCPNYAVAIEVSETKSHLRYDSHTDYGWRSLGHFIDGYTRQKRRFWIGLKELRVDKGWVLVGSGSGKL